jgi:hypothetical protein
LQLLTLFPKSSWWVWVGWLGCTFSSIMASKDGKAVWLQSGLCWKSAHKAKKGPWLWWWGEIW